MAYELTTLFVACEVCDEGRVLKQWRNVWEEVDAGPCPECHGECVVEVEAYPVTLEDLESAGPPEEVVNG